MRCLICHQSIIETATWSQLFTIVSQQNQMPICGQCNQKLELISGEQCRICSRPFIKLDPKYRVEELCTDCFQWEQHPEWQGLLKQNLSIYYYNDFLKELLAQFKFRGDHEIVRIFTNQMQKKFKQTFDQTQTASPLIIPVPLSTERLYERGFNQAVSLARLLNLPITDILTRTHTEKQSKKKKAERLLTDSPFQLKSNIQLDHFHSKSLLLIDDIYTTGTTLRQIAKVLQPLEPKSIISFTLVRS